MRASRSLLAALITTTACGALIIPTTAALAAQGHPGSHLTAFGFSRSADDDPGDDATAGADDPSDDGDEADDTSSVAADDLALAEHIRVRLVAFDTATVTWRFTDGTAPDQLFVRLVPTDGKAIGTTVDGARRAAVLPGLAPGTRYAVTIASIAADGSSTTPVHAHGVRTPSAWAAARDAAKAMAHADRAARIAQRRADRAARRAEAAKGGERLDALAAADAARARASDAVHRARLAERVAERAQHAASDAEGTD